jgi:two-component system response regulator FixJ
LDNDKQRIFIVDDDEAVRDSMRALLELFDFEVQDFGSAVEFLAQYNRTNCGCLLLDLHMPVMGGIELLEHLQAGGSQIPTIVMTGRSDPVLKQRALRSGAFALFDKPVGDAALLDAIGRAIESRKHPAVGTPV